MMTRTKNKFIVLITLLFCLSAFSQETALYKGAIKNDSKKGFKFIEMNPDIRSIANYDFSDLRILDNQQIQIPYFLQEESFSVTESFIPIKNKISYARKNTFVTIKNFNKKLFNYFTFKVSNADVSKNCKIEGSNDNSKWFVVSEKIHLSLNNNSEKSFNYYNIRFPSIDYNYIKLTINDSISAPLNIKNVGYFNRKITRKETLFNTLNYKYNITQKEKTTLIHVTANRKFEINKIMFTIDSPELYNREISFYTLQNNKNKTTERIFKRFTLNSEHNNTISNATIKFTDFWIKINNKDNQPLHIDKISFHQKITYLVADLKANKEYSIIAGDKKLKKPSYDLVNFKDKIETNLSTIKIENGQFFKENETLVKKQFYEQAWFMWVSIGLVALIILGFTLSLLKQTKEA